MPIPVIGLFARLGGLNEGFSRVRYTHGDRIFETILSIETDGMAYQRLELRSIFRKIKERGELDTYYGHLNRELTPDRLLAATVCIAGNDQAGVDCPILRESDSRNRAIEEITVRRLRAIHSGAAPRDRAVGPIRPGVKPNRGAVRH